MRKNPADLPTTAQKLRWYRLKMNLSQYELAERIGVSRTVYRHYEDGRQKLYPKRKLSKLAKIFEITYKDLADDYTLFINSGQAKELLKRRTALDMSPEEYASYLGVSLKKYQSWESGENRMNKKNWELYVKDMGGKSK